MAIIMAIVFFVIGIATGVPPLFAFINGFIVVLIANIPQVSTVGFVLLIYRVIH